jgi:hypothetical protein
VRRRTRRRRRIERREARRSCQIIEINQPSLVAQSNQRL